MAITANKLVSDIRNIVSSGSNPIEFRIEDSQILFWCNEIRAMLIAQAIQKRNDISDTWLQSISCLELEQADKSECCEITTNCVILRTVRELPDTLETTADNFIVRVEDPIGNIISKTTAFEEKYLRHSKYTADKRRWFFKNNRIYIINEDMLETINVWGIFEDPSELKAFTSCDGSTCFNWDTSYPCSLKMANDITNIVIKTKAFPFIQMPQDNTNDANNTTTPPNTKNL
jgi:hypothetical protein